MTHYEIRRDEAAQIIRRNRGQVVTVVHYTVLPTKLKRRADRLAKELEEFAIAILNYDRKVRHAHPDHPSTKNHETTA